MRSVYSRLSNKELAATAHPTQLLNSIIINQMITVLLSPMELSFCWLTHTKLLVGKMDAQGISWQEKNINKK